MAPTEDQPFDAHEASPENVDESYYRFGSYVSKTRMLTFWHQLDDVLNSAPASVLEVGIGPRVVAGTLRELGIAVTTLDVNASLRPDIVGSVLDLEELTGPDAYDTVLCARVLHHLPVASLDHSLAQLAAVASKCVVVTLPVDDLRFYAALRRTAGDYRIVSIGLPHRLKRLLERLGFGRGSGAGGARYRRLWKIDSSADTSADRIRTVVERHFRIVDWYGVPEDRSHAVLVLQPR